MRGVGLYDGLANPLAKVFEKLSVLRLRYRGITGTQKLYLTFVENTLGLKLHTEIQPRLSAERAKQSVGALVPYYLRHVFEIQRLHIHFVRHRGVGHYGRGIGVDEYDLVAFLFERDARLRARVVEFRRLSYNYRTGAYHHYLFNICSLWHFSYLRLSNIL